MTLTMMCKNKKNQTLKKVTELLFFFTLPLNTATSFFLNCINYLLMFLYLSYLPCTIKIDCKIKNFNLIYLSSRTC